MGINDVFLNYIEGESSFNQLDDNYQKAVTTYSHILSEDEVNKYRFKYGKIPTQEIIKLIWKNHPEIQYEHKSFEEYHSWYINHGDTPNHSEQWAVIIGRGCISDEIIEDGWHRFHSYIKNNYNSIPFIIYRKP